MDNDILISALSLFAGVSLLPAGFLILRDRKIPVDRQHTVTGTMAVVIAFVLLGLGTMFALNSVAQDALLLVALLVLLIVLPLGLVAVDKRLKQHKSS